MSRVIGLKLAILFFNVTVLRKKHYPMIKYRLHRASKETNTLNFLLLCSAAGVNSGLDVATTVEHAYLNQIVTEIFYSYSRPIPMGNICKKNSKNYEEKGFSHVL